MPKRAPYFHVYMGLMVVFASYAMGMTMRVREARLHWNTPHGCSRKAVPPPSPAARIAKNYRDGVCLIVGTYSFTDPNGRPLRYISPDSNGWVEFQDEAILNVSFSGTGDVYQRQFNLTGFVVENGKILTTRRAAEPWFGDPDDKRIMNFGGKPRLERLTAYFPASKTPFTLTVDRVSTESDLALCKFNPKGENFPVLPLESTFSGNPSGLAVFTMGFPTGVDGLIAQNSTSIACSGDSPSVEKLTTELAAAGRVVPLIGQGNLQVYTDGRWTTQGVPASESGAGSPLFDPDGYVIGVFSVQSPTKLDGKETSALNPAVPLQKVREFLDGKTVKSVVIEPSKKR